MGARKGEPYEGAQVEGQDDVSTALRPGEASRVLCAVSHPGTLGEPGTGPDPSRRYAPVLVTRFVAGVVLR